MKTRVGAISIVLLMLLAVGVGAQVYSYFTQTTAEVNVTGLEVKLDGTLAQNYAVDEGTMNLSAGESVTTWHNTQFVAGNGENLTISFEVEPLEEGLSCTFYNIANETISNMTLAKGAAATPFYVVYEVSPMMMSGGPYDIIWSIDVPGW